jgi:hypothetical protein
MLVHKLATVETKSKFRGSILGAKGENVDSKYYGIIGESLIQKT